VSIGDELPQIVCETCLTTLVNCCEFQKLIKQSDTKLAEMLSTEQLKLKNIEGPSVPVVKIDIVKATEKVADTDSVAMELENDCPTTLQDG
jgi:hypothetical protein